ncbi:ribosomal-protein-alanine N-acetyltransferase [Paraburkholderia sp. GAS199]|uniref:GNAT family N-acetyltransferase n=1 Tax=Paraburkholderia sp. GAS199 TaxID=3035126 RepID=UPI003D1ED60D
MSIQKFPAAGLRTERLILRCARREDAPDLLAFYLENRSHLQPWDPLRADDFYTVAALEHRLAGMEQQMSTDSALHLLIQHPAGDTVLGECNFTNIVRGPFQACHLGFSIAAKMQGRGLMYEALSRAIEFVFDSYELHRVMANYRPENVRSGRLLERLRFEIEGRARAYLKINGEWADHVLTSRINDEARKAI